jgi:hypothetical protein
MKCLNDCEYFTSFEGEPICKYYDERLLIDDNGSINRCDECEKDGKMGINSNRERALLLKKQLGWMADNFYSFKDDFELILTDMYRILKQMENPNEDERLQEDESDK